MILKYRIHFFIIILLQGKVAANLTRVVLQNPAPVPNLTPNLRMAAIKRVVKKMAVVVVGVGKVDPMRVHRAAPTPKQTPTAWQRSEFAAKSIQKQRIRITGNKILESALALVLEEAANQRRPLARAGVQAPRAVSRWAENNKNNNNAIM